MGLVFKEFPLRRRPHGDAWLSKSGLHGDTFSKVTTVVPLCPSVSLARVLLSFLSSPLLSLLTRSLTWDGTGRG